jgi:hypothetical protein
VSFLGWVDHDAEQQDSILRALGAAKGHDARDELGLGTIRDSFADLFFPGLSTIQQRVRYFLFVQWCCEIAAKEGDADRIVARLHDAEVRLIKALSHLGEGAGVIGILSQEDLERMPSEIYWNGLMVLGMRRTSGSRQRWARQVAANRASGKYEALEEEGIVSSHDVGFDLGRPSPPDEFLQQEVDFTLRADEADFLRARLKNACIDQAGRGHEYNLFGTFSRYRRKTLVRAAWEHPKVADLRPSARDLLMLGAAFSRIMYGAVILYNVCVSRLLEGRENATQILDNHLASFGVWADTLNPADVDLLTRRISELSLFGSMTRHRIDEKAIAFVTRWTRYCQEPSKILGDQAANRLVSDREVFLKSAGGTSRIRSQKARERWGGESGGAMDYRWFTARSCLNDLAAPANA